MPKVKTKRSREPEGWDLVAPTLDSLRSRMREAETADTSKLRKDELQWPIFRLHHQRSRYIYDMYYLQHAISRDCYDYAVKQGHADAALISKWRKPGYEQLCCLRCVQPSNTNYNTTCACRVPKREMEEGKEIECVLCGCRGCATGDGGATRHTAAAT